ncbi:hypothetical protein K402DRAFT_418126 [Aulographum hederae CBS 113979]|uniref:Uncharacterized protein n=1 Tax=Aulographum hederae CBS 113979 TaxID=1176131 RepID=A0A6G1HAI4_9PEZI|nr:hypothetical protein K402DRAFT_418126 [Aulographum hederae CBS 113979]
MAQTNESDNLPPWGFVANLESFQLDIVGFLAILGEGSVLANSQVATLSKMVFLPRLLPAPQALLRPSRPEKLEPTTGWVTGVESGNDRAWVNHVGNVILDAESMPEYSVRCVEIRRIKNGPVKAESMGDVKADSMGPLGLIALFGSALSCVLLALSIWQADGMAVLAVLLLSLLSTLIGFGNYWVLKLPQQYEPNEAAPVGDVVIRYPKGNFLVVQCTEDVARQLYFAPETVNYMMEDPVAYRMLSLVGTLMLMLGVIALGNSSSGLQIGFAASYMMLNAGYWIVAALPAKKHWHTKGFEVIPQSFDLTRVPSPTPQPDAEKEKKLSKKEKFEKLKQDKIEKLKQDKKRKKAAKTYTDLNATFTQAMWKVMVATKSKDWAIRSEAAPSTDAWQQWLHDAEEQASIAHVNEVQLPNKDGIMVTTKSFVVPDWDPQARLKDLLKEHPAQRGKIRGV